VHDVVAGGRDFDATGLPNREFGTPGNEAEWRRSVHHMTAAERAAAAADARVVEQAKRVADAPLSFAPALGATRGTLKKCSLDRAAPLCSEPHRIRKLRVDAHTYSQFASEPYVERAVATITRDAVDLADDLDDFVARSSQAESTLDSFKNTLSRRVPIKPVSLTEKSCDPSRWGVH
jgi:hypothetical protein